MSQAYSPSTYIPMDRRQAMARDVVLPQRSQLGDGQVRPCAADSQEDRSAVRALYEVRALSSENLRINQERGDGIARACCRADLPSPAAGIALTLGQVITEALAD
jgi:hypothetical protein